MLAGSKQERFELFKREFINPATPEANRIPITSYYPTSDYKSIIITGSNTGGKTVAIKTIGLFLLMTKSGLFLPCQDHQHTQWHSS